MYIYAGGERSMIFAWAFPSVDVSYQSFDTFFNQFCFGKEELCVIVIITLRLGGGGRVRVPNDMMSFL